MQIISESSVDGRISMFFYGFNYKISLSLAFGKEFDKIFEFDLVIERNEENNWGCKVWCPYIKLSLWPVGLPTDKWAEPWLYFFMFLI